MRAHLPVDPLEVLLEVVERVLADLLLAVAVAVHSVLPVHV